MSLANPVVDSFDGNTRRIFLKQGVTTFHWIEDIYAEYVHERKTVETFRKWEALMVGSGNKPKKPGKFTPRLLTLNTDRRGITTKVIPFDEPSYLFVRGEAITDVADVDPNLFDYSTITNPVIVEYEPPSAEVIVVDAIEKRLDYGNVLYLDTASPHAGQLHPKGTAAEPVNNLDDGLALIQTYGLNSINLKGGISPANTDDLSNINIVGGAGNGNGIILSGGPTISTDFSKVVISGALGGSVNIENCIIGADVLGGITELQGQVKDSIINHAAGIIQASGGTGTRFDNCSFYAPNNPQITVNANGESIVFRNTTGNILLTNYTKVEGTQVHLTGASFEVDPSCTAGTLVFSGYGKIIDNSGGTVIVDNLAADDIVKLDIDWLVKWARADEEKNVQNNKYYKREAGTSNVLIEKDYIKDANNNETLIEA